MIRGEILKISARNLLRPLWFLIAIAMFWITQVYVDYITDYTQTSLSILLLSVFILFAFIAIPPLILYFDYYYRNKRTEYEILPDRIITRKNIREETYLKSDIEEISVYVHRYFVWSHFFHYYSFVRIDMKNGESIYLTSLLYPKKTKNAEDMVKKFFAGIPYYKIGRQFCSTRYKSWSEKKVECDTDPYGLFKDDDREYNSITEFKDTRKTKTKIENKNINTNDTKKS